MKTKRILPNTSTRLSAGFLAATVLSAFALTLCACAPKSTPTIFVPPTAPIQIIPATSIATDSVGTIIPTIEPTIVTSTPPCTDNLKYIQDLTIPDDTPVTAGQTIDKQWLISNSGTCNWDSHYLLKLINGNAMGAPTEQALYPARAGAQATLRIVFTAPTAAGTYRSAWQAYGPGNEAFGDPIYIQINVTQ